MMTHYPYIEAWAVYLHLGPDWLANTVARATADNAPPDTWAYSVGLERWSTLRDLAEQAALNNAQAQRTYKALVAIGRVIAEDDTILHDMLASAPSEDLWA